MVGLSLAAVSVACGLFALWIFGRTTDLAAVRSTIKRIQAHLLEFRLFYDEPRLIWRAQKAILRENLRFFLLMVRPAMILTLPMAWLLFQLEAVYAYAPLPIGEPSVITAQVSGQLILEDVAATLQMPPGISVETLPVRSMADRQISWRIRPLRPVRGILRLGFGGAAIDKTIAAGTRPIFLVRKRVRSLLQFLLCPEEARLPVGEIAWVEVDYPKTDVIIAGIALPWIAWFVLISTLSALVFARWFRIWLT
jgi:hypothetical protein